MIQHMDTYIIHTNLFITIKQR